MMTKTHVCPTCGGKGSLPDPAALRVKRIKLRLSLSEVARKMGISTSYLCDLELGRRKWDQPLAKKFTLALRP